MKRIEENEAYVLYTPEPDSRLYQTIEEVTAAENAYDEMTAIVEDLSARHTGVETAIATVDWSSDVDDMADMFARLPVLARMLGAAENEKAARLRRLQRAESSLRSVRRSMESYSEAIAEMEKQGERMGTQGRDVRQERIAAAQEGLQQARAAALTA